MHDLRTSLCLTMEMTPTCWRRKVTASVAVGRDEVFRPLKVEAMDCLSHPKPQGGGRRSWSGWWEADSRRYAGDGS